MCKLYSFYTSGLDKINSNFIFIVIWFNNRGFGRRKNFLIEYISVIILIFYTELRKFFCNVNVIGSHICTVSKIGHFTLFLANDFIWTLKMFTYMEMFCSLMTDFIYLSFLFSWKQSSPKMYMHMTKNNNR